MTDVEPVKASQLPEPGENEDLGNNNFITANGDMLKKVSGSRLLDWILSITIGDEEGDTVLPPTVKSSISTVIIALFKNIKKLLSYFTDATSGDIGVLPIANGGTGNTIPSKAFKALGGKHFSYYPPPGTKWLKVHLDRAVIDKDLSIMSSNSSSAVCIIQLRNNSNSGAKMYAGNTIPRLWKVDNSTFIVGFSGYGYMSGGFHLFSTNVLEVTFEIASSLSEATEIDVIDLRYIGVQLPVSIANGGTGAITIVEARENLGIEAVLQEMKDYIDEKFKLAEMPMSCLR
jgi:hypothetical protein